MVSTFDILFVSETKLDSYDLIKIPEYTFISQPRKQKYQRKSGRLGVFIKNDISHYVQYIKTDCDYVQWITLSKDYTKTDNDIMFGSL